ncbi:hypothetical protein QJQ45_016063, partial [Haematococcus lacustris]
TRQLPPSFHSPTSQPQASGQSVFTCARQQQQGPSPPGQQPLLPPQQQQQQQQQEGVMSPTDMPALLALATDPAPDISAKALKVLKAGWLQLQTCSCLPSAAVCASELPFKKAEEPLTPDAPDQHPRGPAALASLKEACMALCLLLLLKRFLREAYKLADERVAAFQPSNTLARKAEEKMGVTRDPQVELALSTLDLAAPSADLASRRPLRVYRDAKFLLAEDAANYQLAEQGEGASPQEASPDPLAAGPDSGGAPAARSALAAAVTSTSLPLGPQGGAATTGAAKLKRKRRATGLDTSSEDAEDDAGDGDDSPGSMRSPGSEASPGRAASYLSARISSRPARNIKRKLTEDM